MNTSAQKTPLIFSLFMYMDIHADLERGMAEEHLLKPDSKEGVTTNNYGVRYTLLVVVHF
jgi:hypothetical protein